jgi:histidine triad (HIT) family protein
MATDHTETCFVCRKHRGELQMPGGVVYQDDLVYVSHGTMKPDGLTYPGIFFVEPRRHVPTMADLTRPESERVGWLASVVSRALAREGAERSYLEVLGHHVPHLHVWIVPRSPTHRPSTSVFVCLIGKRAHASPGRRSPSCAHECRATCEMKSPPKRGMQPTPLTQAVRRRALVS